MTPIDLRQLDALLRNDVVYMTSLKVRSLDHRFSERSLNSFAVTELLYRTMYQRPTPYKHTKRRSCTTTPGSLIVASKLPGKDELLTYPAVAQHAVCIWCYGRRDRPEKGVL